MQTEYIEQTTAKKIPVLFGENVILMPFYDVFDMEDFIRLHREDKQGYMCRFCLKYLSEIQAEDYVRKLIDEGQIYIWSVLLKDDKEKKAGFIYLSDVKGHSASISGIMDMKFARSMKGKIKHQYADDATLTLINACFHNGFIRIEGDALANDRKAIALHKRLGFKQEGVLRKAVDIDGDYKDLVIVSKIKGE